MLWPCFKKPIWRITSMLEIIRNLARRQLRSTLTISGIVIGIFALTTMGAMAEHFNALIDGGVKYFGSSIQVGPPDGQQGALLPLSKVDEVKKVDGVAAAFPGYGFAAKPGDVATVSFNVPDQIVAGDPREDRYSVLEISAAQGQKLPGGRGEVVLGSSIANEFKKNVGDSISLP